VSPTQTRLPHALLKSVILNDLEWLSEIFNDTKHRTTSLWLLVCRASVLYRVVLKNADNADTANYGCDADNNTTQTTRTAVIKLQATAISIEMQTNHTMQAQQLMDVAVRWAMSRWAVITNLTLILTTVLLTLILLTLLNLLTLKIRNKWGFRYLLHWPHRCIGLFLR